MNERIKELAEQAWDTTAVSPDFGHPVSFAEKFSDLLIQRFIHLIGDQELSFHYLEEPEGVDAMRVLRDYVKEHFEVK